MKIFLKTNILLLFRYSSRILPHQEKDLKKWLRSIWKGKEILLQNFYTVKHFPTEKLKEDSYENINFQIKINGETSREKSSHEFELNSLQYTSSNEKSIINENVDDGDCYFKAPLPPVFKF